MSMQVDFDEATLDRLETDFDFTAGFSPELVRGYRKVMQSIRAAPDERTLHALRELEFEKLKGKRQQQYSLRIDKQWRLITELRHKATDTWIAIVAMEDYQ